MKQKNSKNKKAYSMVEALMAMIIVSTVILMLAPILAGRSQRTSGSVCVQGNSLLVTSSSSGVLCMRNGSIVPSSGRACQNPDTDKILYQSNTFYIQPGMERIWITAIGHGGPGADGGYGQYGSPAGNASSTVYYNDGKGLNVVSTKARTIDVVVGKDASATVKGPTIAGNPVIIDSITSKGVGTAAGGVNGTWESNRASHLRGGEPRYSDFRGGIFGSGGRGEYGWTASGDGGVAAVLIEWPTNCVND